MSFPAVLPDWTNLAVLHRNALPARAHFFSYASEAAALSFDRDQSEYQSLNGTWKFHYASSPFEAPNWSTANTSSWADIEVPGMWQMQGYGNPHYTNIKYPFPVTPPNVSYINPTGSYYREFDVSDSWDGQQIHIRFEGVDSAFHLEVNGQPAGYSSLGSRNPSEFDITSYLNPSGESNNVSVRVYQWSHGTYIEDQDQWWLSGIFRDVFLIPFAESAVVDLELYPELDDSFTMGTLRTNVTIQGDHGPLHIKLLSPDRNTTIGEWNGTSSDISSIAVSNPSLWSAETPTLYTALITFANRTISQRVGFRRIEMSPEGTSFLVNGVPIKMYGVNRHEHHHLSGRTVPRAALYADLLAMKRHNLNAIRTSHQPPHPDLFDFADELGFYVIAEADLECHGFGDSGTNRPAESFTTDNPEWEAAYVNRAVQLVKRLRNHAAIIFWSLGNEAFFGRNMVAMARWIRGADPSRLVHYEADFDATVVDVYSRMYMSPQEIRDFIVTHPDKPLIMCEFAHAMGNGPGALDEYVQAFRSSPQIQGGMVWEWANHGLLKKEGDLEYYAYGGDFGDFPNDRDFIMDGLMLSDHSPMPSIGEYKKAIQPVEVTWGDGGAASGRIVVRNHYGFVDLSHLDATLHIVQDGSVTGSRSLNVSVQAGSQATVDVPFNKDELQDGEAFLTVEFRLRDDTNWADRGHLIAWDQLHIPPTSPALSKQQDIPYQPSLSLLPRQQEPTVSNGTHLTIISGASTFTFDLIRGNLTWSLDGGPSILRRGPELNFIRAQTQNDEAGGGDGRNVWNPARVDELHPQVRDVTWSITADDATVVRFQVRVAPKTRVWGAQAELVYTIPAAGNRLTLHTTGSFPNATGGVPETLPRIGLLAWLPTSFSDVSWFGRGPGESYRDSKRAARFGNWNGTTDSLYVRYDYPQEHGGREDARWVAVHDATSGVGLRARMTTSDGRGNGADDGTGGEAFAFYAGRYMPEDLNRAKHPHELKKVDHTVLNLDYRGNGLGSATVGPRPLEHVRCRPEPFDFTFELEALEG